MMASMCLHMLIGVMVKNVGIQLLEPILMIIEAIQTNVEDDEDIIIVPIEEKAMN